MHQKWAYYFGTHTVCTRVVIFLFSVPQVSANCMFFLLPTSCYSNASTHDNPTNGIIKGYLL